MGEINEKRFPGNCELADAHEICVLSAEKCEKGALPEFLESTTR